MFKKLVSVFVAAVMLFACLPAAFAVSVEDYDPIGDDISATVSPYLEEGGFESEDYFLTIDDFASHYITFINIWSNGCGPCIAEMPYFQQIHEEFGDQGVLVVGGCTTWISGNFAAEYEYLQSHGYTYINVIPDDTLRNLDYHNNSGPQTFIVNSEGVVVDFIGGGTNYATLVQKIQYWLAIYGGDQEDHTVTFIDGLTNEVIETQTVQHAHAAVYPAAPEHQGYDFTGWDPASLPMVLQDEVVIANYNPKVYRVRFFDSITGERLKQQFVQYGQAATPPEAPEHEGYTFVGWDQDYTFISDAIDIYTIYQPSDATPGDVNGDGTVNANDALMILRAALNLVQLTDSQIAIADVNNDGTVNANDALAVMRIALGL